MLEKASDFGKSRFQHPAQYLAPC